MKQADISSDKMLQLIQAALTKYPEFLLKLIFYSENSRISDNMLLSGDEERI